MAGESKEDFYYRKETSASAERKQPTGKNRSGDKRKAKPSQKKTRGYKVPAKSKKKPRSNWKKGLVILIIAAILIALVLSPLSNLFSTPWGGPTYPEKAHFKIKRTISVTSSREINYEIDVPVPENITGNDIQRISDLNWYGTPEDEIRYGHPWKIWKGSLVETSEFTMYYEVSTKTVKWEYSSENSGNVEDIAESWKTKFNRDQWPVDYDNDGETDDRDGDGRVDIMIEPENAEIQGLADEIIQGEDNLYDKTRAIYDWINDNIEYERGSPGLSSQYNLPQHALCTLRTKAGDCDEQSFLFCSLARAVGIPAWMELGVLYDRVVEEWGGHGWIRLMYVSDDGDSGWVNIDPVNDQFFARDATRFTSWVDDGGEGHLEDYYMFITYNYSTGGGRPRISISDEYENLQMETEGEVDLGDEDDLPWMSTTLMIPAVIVSSLIYEKKRKDG